MAVVTLSNESGTCTPDNTKCYAYGPDRELTTSTTIFPQAYFKNSNSKCKVTYSIVDSLKNPYTVETIHNGVITVSTPNVSGIQKVTLNQDPSIYKGGNFIAYIKATTNAVDGLTNAKMAAYT